MSLEVALQELTQAVLLNTRSLDLLMAQVAELNERPEVVLQAAESPEGQVNQTLTKPKTVGKKEKQEVKQGLTEEQVKDSEEYKTLIQAMGAHNALALQRHGGDKDKARAETIAIIKQYTEDGKAVTIVQQLLEDETTRETFDELIDAYVSASEALQASDEETNMDKEDDDFGGGDNDEVVEYTAEDVKKALRAYAAVEGKPAAIGMLKSSTGSASVAGIDPKDYAKAIKALEV